MWGGEPLMSLAVPNRVTCFQVRNRDVDHDVSGYWHCLLYHWSWQLVLLGITCLTIAAVLTEACGLLSPAILQCGMYRLG
jgi:hypothetical protein